MHVSVIGAGGIGATLGAAFARTGHDVTFGVRDPSARALPEGLPDGVHLADVGTALSAADVVVLAVPGPAVAELAREQAAALEGRLVIDATNNVRGGPVNGYVALIAAAPRLRYARAFNSLGVENLRDPRFGEERADMLFSAPEPDRAVVAELVEAVGLRPVWLGEGAHDTVDGLLPVWFTLSRRLGRHLAFRVLTDSGDV